MTSDLSPPEEEETIDKGIVPWWEPSNPLGYEYTWRGKQDSPRRSACFTPNEIINPCFRQTSHALLSEMTPAFLPWIWCNSTQSYDIYIIIQHDIFVDISRLRIFHPIFAGVLGSWLALALWAQQDETRSFREVLVTYSSPGGAGPLMSMLLKLGSTSRGGVSCIHIHMYIYIYNIKFSYITYI